MPRIFDNIEQALLPALAETSTIRPRRTSRNDWSKNSTKNCPWVRRPGGRGRRA